MMRLKKRLLTGKNWMTFPALLLALGLVLLPVIAGAAEEATEEATEDYILEDTVVTATKTGETRLQETPLSITVFDYEKMKNSGIESMFDIGNKTPGVTISPQASSAFIRGIGSDNPLLGGSETVGVYVDEVYMSRITGFAMGFLDLNRIEFLRGPQGTLYGRNTTGGAIKLFTADPTDELEGYLEGSLVRGDSFIGEAAVRLAVNYTDAEGWIDDVGGGDNLNCTETLMGRLKLDYRPSENVDIRFSLDGATSDLTSGFPMRPIDPTPFIQAGAVDAFSWDESYNNYPESSGEINYGGGSLSVDWNLSQGLVLKSITALRDYKGDYGRNDFDGTSLDLWNSESIVQYKQASQELQFNVVKGAFKLVNGLFYMKEEESNLADSYILYNLGLPFGVDYLNEYDAENDTTTFAVFTQGEYSLTDKINLLAGLRYTNEKKEISVNTDSSIDLNPGFGLPPGTVPSLVIRTITAYMNEDNWDAWTPKVGIDYRLSDDVFLYASITNGFKSGG
ncbi:MAG: TonB-dependent receptor, partial [Deltaproteobacteria bacterium]|nr:TonB-dependent receptor [Deltaproteobacteria bacterium]